MFNRKWIKNVQPGYELTIQYKLTEQEEIELKELTKVLNELLGEKNITPEIFLRSALEYELSQISHREMLDKVGNIIAQCRAMKHRSNQALNT